MENLREKNETEIQNKMVGHSSRIEQTEEKISELDDDIINLFLHFFIFFVFVVLEFLECLLYILVDHV
jgi:hypothetical protein